MAHVFLSHSSADSKGAMAVAQLLRNAGLQVWLDLDQLTPGEQWQPALEHGLKDSSHFVVLVGESGVQRWVDREVRYALDRNTLDPNYRVIPLLGAGARENALPLFLQQQQYLRLDWRQPDAAAVQRIAAAIVEAPPERVNVLQPGTSPFRGLLTFDTEDSLLFFGRDREIDELLDRLRTARFLPVIGDSGSGKSSLVRAGLIPALLRGRGGNVDWRIAIMKPGEDPLDLLAEAVPQFDPELGAGERLDLIDKAKRCLRREGSTDGLSEILAALQLPSSSRQLLVIDQFEQLFTHSRQRAGTDQAEARFIATVLRAAQRRDSTLQVVATLRADFVGLCYAYPDLWQLVTGQHYAVRRMERDCLRDVIVRPMALAGVGHDSGLVDTMIEEAGSQPGALALLEHALDQLWRESGGRAPTSDDYNQIGRLKGAIRRHADWVLDKRLVTKQQRETARRIFIELTAVGEGPEDSARRVPKAGLVSLPGGGAEEVLQVLTDERLVITGAEADREVVSIAHETLIRGWGSLRAWVDGRRQDILLHRELERSAEEWATRRDADLLWRGGRLEQAIQWRQRNPDEVRPEVETFIRASRNRRRRDGVFRWGSVLAIMGLLFVLALPTMRDVLLRARARMSVTRVNAKDGLTYVRISPGEFVMGCSGSECSDRETTHRVHITREFWIGQTEVTQAAYRRVIGSPDPSLFRGENRPVEGVSWNEADKYCREVGMRLPTEAEWEYAARAGNTEEHYSSLDKIAVYGSSSGTAEVGSKLPNAWGLYDTLGNVSEWTSDWFDTDYYKSSPVDDPKGPEQTGFKVARGGSWFTVPLVVRVSSRSGYRPTDRIGGCGFRCAGDLP